MINRRTGPLPWDIAVFLIVTTVGFGYTVQKFMAGLFQEATVQAQTEKGTEQTLDLGCLEGKTSPGRLLHDEGPMRVRGRLCYSSREGKKKLEGIQVKNLSNGFVATVYLQGYDTSFVTDFISMNAGKNSLQVQWPESKMAEPKTVVAEVFQRQRLSSSLASSGREGR